MRLILPDATTRTGHRLTLVITVTLVLTAVAAGVAVTRVGKLPDDVALRVGGTEVTRTQVQHRLDTLRAIYSLRVPEGADGHDRFRRAGAKSVATAMVIESSAAARGVHTSDREAEERLAGLIKSMFGKGGTSAFYRDLGARGTTRAEVLAEITRNLTTAKLFDRVTKRVRVTDREVRRHFDANRGKYDTPRGRHLRNIVVATRAEADRVLRQAKSGTAFADLAQRYSLDASSKDAGGDLGALRPDQLDAKYRKAAFSARSGALFGPVQTRFGWNVGQVVTARPPAPATYREVRDAVEADLHAEKAMSTWRSWLGARIREVGVEYAAEYRPADPGAASSGHEIPAGVPEREAARQKGGAPR